MTYRLAGALIALRDEIDAWRPDRDRASDGWIGDAAHAARDSDHNPWIVDRNGIGVVRAIDVDEDGIDGPGLVEHLRKLGAAGDPRLADFGYLIYEGRIAGGNPKRGPDRWNWRPYSGTNPHRHHFHISATRDPAGYDRPGPWGVLHPLPTPKDPDVTPEQLDAAIAKALAPLAADVAEIRRQVAVSQDATAKGGRTLRHIIASVLNKG